MGNSESSSQFPPPPSDHDAKKFTERGRGGERESTESSSAGKALAAVAGGALLALGAYSLASPSDHDAKKFTERGRGGERESTESSSAGKALAAVAGPGGALLALGAYSLASSSSSDSDSSDEERAVAKMEKLRLGGFPTSYGSGNSDEPSFSRMIKILSYNVWFREDVEVHERMKAIGKIIQQHSPDVIFFQEVTPYIYDIFQSSNWRKAYECSVLPEQAKNRRYFSMLLSKLPVTQFRSKRFENSTMGRELCVAAIEAGAGKKLIVATSHLESPTPGTMNSAERVAQAEEALRLLNFADNVVFGGDMNWVEAPNADGPFPLLDGWYDPWSVLKPGEDGWTYDVKSNGMLRGMRPFRTRLDRFACKLADFKPVGIRMVGTEAIPGISWYNKGKVLPVLPSDHYGLLLTICPV
ncbi:uncharacterized protein M6B38_323620 [Iris pallida]|uniref:Endonuclease/exonuclease/phosphatase domain-containing protein n=1 Tax=Iris pallida TaxID=29817 RepID=A0AAX6HBZ9_IRIPA|nr:uncharacterized protein M6B38_323620 [Iris pallida]